VDGTGIRCTLVLVALAGADDAPPSELIEQLAQVGAAVYVTHGARGCLRVATSLGPHTIFLDPRLPQSLLPLLRAHPTSATGRVEWLRAA
jgi:hypothetical protein